jgi:hypothetical protein
MKRINRAPLLLALAAVALVSTNCGAASTTATVRAKPEKGFYAKSAFISCLKHLWLAYLPLERRQFTAPLNGFADLTGYVLVPTNPSASNPHAKAKIDNVQLFFFKDAKSAREAQPKLARFYVYFDPPFNYLRYLRHVPPNAAAARSIERMEGNVDIFWNYPRHDAKASDQTLARCLTAT